MIKHFRRLPYWLKDNVFYRANLKTESEKYDKKKEGARSSCHPYDANIIASKTFLGKHKLFLDLDVEHEYIQSSTPGHAHLVVNVDLEYDDMIEVLTVLQKHNIVQKGFLDATKDRKWAALRMPGIDKYKAENNRWFYEEWANEVEVNSYTPVDFNGQSASHEAFILNQDQSMFVLQDPF